MKKIQFLGASSDEVTGSAYLVTLADDSKVLVDLGMFQGTEEIENLNFQSLAFNPAELKAVFLTHAHLDHCGRLPLLVFGGFLGNIYMTPPTRALVEIILADSARIAEKDMNHEPLYTMDEVYKTLEMIETVDYDTELTVGNVTATFRDAGHILGSSSIELLDNVSQKRIVFSGDLGNTPQDLVRPTEYIESADYVVMESTYGDAAHPQENAREIIQEEINAVEKNGGILLIPAFSLERTQELLHIVHHLKKEHKVAETTPFFLDSPMGIEATALYHDFSKYYNDELKSHTDDPFSFPGLKVTAEPRESKEIYHEPNPKVIIAGSGMMNGGRIQMHAQFYLNRETTRILFVGYQAEDTLGRNILEGAKQVTIAKQNIRVLAHIGEIKILSSHADLPRLLKWIGHIQAVKTVFITHGEKSQREGLKHAIEHDLKLHEIILPRIGEEVPLS